VTVEVDDTVLRILDEHDQIITVVARTTPKEVTPTRPMGTATAPRPRKCYPSDEAKPSRIRWH
jgi:hypothetical protein